LNYSELEADQMDLSPTVSLLISDPSRKKDAFPFQREISLFQFQTWIYFPRPLRSQMVKASSILAAARFLELRRKKLIPMNRRADLSGFKKLLNDAEYGRLFEATLCRKGGWIDLLSVPRPAEFDDAVQQRIKISNVVCNIIDYKFRYLDHGGADKRQAMTNRGEFYVWKKFDVSWRTIRKHWQESKYGAVFLYVSEKLGLNFSPAPIGVASEKFTQTLYRQAQDVASIRKFFGTCAYVSEKISHYPKQESEDDDDDPFPAIPLSVERIRPQADPLSPHDLDLMSRFESEKVDMRNDLRDRDA
jgi:hypothetical protein